jgi:hypothetical protein
MGTVSFPAAAMVADCSDRMKMKRVAGRAVVFVTRFNCLKVLIRLQTTHSALLSRQKMVTKTKKN